MGEGGPFFLRKTVFLGRKPCENDFLVKENALPPRRNGFWVYGFENLFFCRKSGAFFRFRGKIILLVGLRFFVTADGWHVAHLREFVVQGAETRSFSVVCPFREKTVLRGARQGKRREEKTALRCFGPKNRYVSSGRSCGMVGGAMWGVPFGKI